MEVTIEFIGVIARPRVEDVPATVTLMALLIPLSDARHTNGNAHHTNGTRHHTNDAAYHTNDTGR